MPSLHLVVGGSSVVEAGGQTANKIEDASAGMQRAPDGAGNVWAYNARAGQWMRLVVQKADGTTILSTLAKKFYNDANRWREIANLAENTPICGSQGDKCIPGDTILIPNLSQPFAPPAGATPTGDTPSPVVVGDVPTPTPTGTGSITIPGIGAVPIPTGDTPPPGWPSGIPWPPTGTPTQVGTGDTPSPTGDVPTPVPGGGTGDTPAKTPAGSTSITTTKGEEPFWTPVKIGVAVVGGVAILGTVVYFATRKKRRSRRR